MIWLWFRFPLIDVIVTLVTRQMDGQDNPRYCGQVVHIGDFSPMLPVLPSPQGASRALHFDASTSRYRNRRQTPCPNRVVG